jgi:hypothetical protein
MLQQADKYVCTEGTSIHSAYLLLLFFNLFNDAECYRLPRPVVRLINMGRTRKKGVAEGLRKPRRYRQSLGRHFNISTRNSSSVNEEF